MPKRGVYAWDPKYIPSVWVKLYAIIVLPKTRVAAAGIMASRVRELVRQYSPTNIPARIAVSICRDKRPYLAEAIASSLSVSDWDIVIDNAVRRLPIGKRAATHWSCLLTDANNGAHGHAAPVE